MADLPTARELELETLLRQRDAQVAELTDEVAQLRQYLSTQPAPSTTDPISLPPALVSLLLPHINDRPLNNATATSNSVTAALTQRAKVLQEENDELYELLKTGETGRLKEDVRALRRVVQKLEGALEESHQVIASLSSELDKSHEAVMASGRLANAPSIHAPSHSPTPRNVYQAPPHLVSATNGKPLPTGPRAHKKPRLSESHTPPARSNVSLPPPTKTFATNANSIPIKDVRGRRGSTDKKPPANNVDVAEDQRKRPRSPEPERDRDRVRGRDKDKEREKETEPDRDRARERDRDRGRDKEHERDRDRSSRRTGGRSYMSNSSAGSGGAQSVAGGGGGRRGRGANNGNAAYPGGDRTLAERMGL
ncbi:hypothetical protein BKA93DRAFT_275578 [Sparassis latifolia]|uniref:Uncharacterized protein n=1 Tax=Sparassis crispa TaxID=139825 RepID=A0A401GBX5_9APHY|nr:hypothetical protein SCP_0208550 [Sparassis crispa]GBE79655.1 hypothetical protein SCP_0208550 [Sparassis crispa]